MPRLRAAETPAFSWRISVIGNSPKAFTTPEPPSVEPSSTTMTARGGTVWAATLSRQRRTNGALL